MDCRRSVDDAGEAMHCVPIVHQRDDHDCGPACVEAVASYYGRVVDFDSLVVACRTTFKHGTDPEDLVSVLLAGGLRSQIDEPMTIDELSEAAANGPVICPIVAYGSGHWCVVVKVAKTRITVMDPASSSRAYRTLPVSDWLRRWHDTDRRGRSRVRLGISVRARCRRHAVEKGIPE